MHIRDRIDERSVCQCDMVGVFLFCLLSSVRFTVGTPSSGDIKEIIYLLQQTNSRMLVLENEVRQLKVENDLLRRQSIDSKEICSELKSAFLDLQMNVLQDYTAGKENMTHIPNQGLGNIIRNNRRLGSGASTKIAFTAKNSGDIGQLGNHQTILFNQVLSNIGGKYNTFTGVFNPDIAGVYLFFFDLRILEHQTVYATLVKDGVTQVETYADTTGINLHHIADSNMAIIHLEKGNSVWIQTVQVHDHTAPAVDDGSTFSGFLLYPDE